MQNISNFICETGGVGVACAIVKLVFMSSLPFMGYDSFSDFYLRRVNQSLCESH